MKTKLLTIVLISVLFGFFSCAKKTENKEIQLNLKISPQPLTDFLYANIDYEFKTGANFKKFAKDYTVFVHFWRTASKEILLQDDHQPVKKTSLWTAKDTIRYSRVVFIPQFLNEFDIDFEGYEEIKISVGLYNSDPASKEEPILLWEKKINFQPASINAPEIIYDEGWNEQETNLKSDNVFERSWRWTTQKSVCIIENPKKPSILIIKGSVDKAAIPSQKVIFKINDAVLDEFTPESSKFSKEYSITPGQMGGNDEFTLTIETDKAFVPARINPANRDNRELGVAIFLLYFREK